MSENVRKTAQQDASDLLHRRLFRAIVTSTSPFQITREGFTTAESASRLSNYTPVLNDLVIVVQVTPRLVVLGKETP